MNITIMIQILPWRGSRHDSSDLVNRNIQHITLQPVNSIEADEVGTLTTKCGD